MKNVLYLFSTSKSNSNLRYPKSSGSLNNFCHVMKISVHFILDLQSNLGENIFFLCLFPKGHDRKISLFEDCLSVRCDS